ncbi:MAG: outer membrane protein assembly factor BamB family protein, partial [Planctomycetota bacterium]
GTFPTLGAVLILALSLGSPDSLAGQNWPSFRGPGACGRAEGFTTVLKWNVEEEENVLWKVWIPGLGLSSPVVWGDDVFLTTAVGTGKEAELKVGLYGSVGSVDNEGVLGWHLICVDGKSGKIRWSRLAHKGEPKVKRHPKSSHANATAVTDGDNVVAFFGSEGLHCFDRSGKPRWKVDLGTLDWGWYVRPTAQWGGGSSPVIHGESVILQCDVQGDSYLAAFSLKDGAVKWKTVRKDVPTWSTPTLYEQGGRTRIVVNGYKHIGGYDAETGREVWRMSGGGDIPVPTPVLGRGLMFITNAHGRMSPIFAVKFSALGDVSLKEGETSNDHVAWSIRRGGNYMQTPIVYGDHIFACRDSGVLSCFVAATGEKLFSERIGSRGEGFTASPVGADGKLYFASERGNVYVIKAAGEFELLARNEMGEPCMATPAISEGVIFIRSHRHLVAVGRK